MRALNDYLQVVGINVHIMLAPVFSNRFTNLVLHFRCNRMFRGVHVSYFRPAKPSRECVPCFCVNMVVFSDIEAPYLAGRRL